MPDPTTEPGRHWVEPYARTAAQIIAAALTDQTSAVVARAVIRRGWYRRYPHQQRRASSGRGTVGRTRLNDGLRCLEQQGVIKRHRDDVRVLDRAKLTTIANTADRDDNTGGAR